MRLTKLLILFVASAIMSLTAIAKPITEPTPIPYYSTSKDIAPTTTVHSIKLKKPGLLKKLIINTYLKKMMKHHLLPEDLTKADKNAKASLIMGIAALASIFIPYAALLTIPLGIMAIVFGNQALHNGTTKPSKAKLGKAFGIASLITLVVVAIIAVLVLAAFLSAWG